MFIIANQKIIAKVDTGVAGTPVRFSRQRCEEQIDAARDWNLVNANEGRLSNAAKWHQKWAGTPCGDFAKEINPGEYFIA